MSLTVITDRLYSVSEKQLLSVIRGVGVSTLLLGFCVAQTGPSLGSRHTRDKKVSGWTLASLGISFTGGKRPLIRQQIRPMCSNGQQESRGVGHGCAGLPGPVAALVL